MPEPETTCYRATTVKEALAEFEKALSDGQPPALNAFLAQHPEVAAELKPHLEAYLETNAHTMPLLEDPDDSPAEPIPRLDEYEILGELGRGGMGVVYKARQKGTEQVVALKMLRQAWIEAMDGEHRREAIDQFRLEVKAAARLRHPNRVRILQVGDHEGLPFYAMELIEGCTLAEKLKQPGGVSKEAVLKYLAGVAEAVHEAHVNAILHRDLKPHNILIDERTDQAILTDFGLAKIGGPTPDAGAGEDSIRQQARMVGTLPYMSPEQTWDLDRVTEASDVYSLGATLYEMLTGGPPFEGRSRSELVQMIREEAPVSPRERALDVNPRVEKICLKCLEKDPAKRYGSALELATALRRFLLEVGYARHFTSMGTMHLVLGPVILLINLTVYLLLERHAPEPVIWLVMFSMYPALFSMFLLAPSNYEGVDHVHSRVELWTIWGGKFFAAVSISIALRTAFHDDPEKALVLVYPVFAALSGMAVFIMVGKMERKLYVLAFGCWLIGIVMVFHLAWAPIIYGIYSMCGVILQGLYLRTLGNELG